MAGKMWRSRGRSVFYNMILFGLGVMTCLICLQVFASTGIDDPVVFTNSEEYRLALQVKQPPEALPLQQLAEQGESLLLNANNQGGTNQQQAPPILCATTGSGNGETTKQDFSKNANNDIPIAKTYRDVAEGESRRRSNNEFETSSTNRNTNINEGGDISKSSQLEKNTKPDLRSHQEELKHFEGVALPPDNNNNLNPNDILSGKDLLDENNNFGDGSQGPTVYVVTPTFYRPEQKPELTRVAQALLPVSDFVHWIVVEDVSKGTDTSFEELRKFLQRFPLVATLLKSLPPKSRIVGKPRGVGGRTSAIAWLRENAQEGVVYFADDDNTYDSSIFKQMQFTEKVTMWPVGLVTDLGVSSPIVKNGRVVGFYDGWNGQRKFPVDMAGFAINLQLFLDKPKASMPWKAGYEEDELLQNLGITMKDIKPLANNCTEILVWHTKAVKNVWPKRPKNLSPSVASNTNLHTLLSQLPQKSPVSPADTHNKSDTGFSFLRMFFGSGA